jgi:FkbM family methyltransferase
LYGYHLPNHPRKWWVHNRLLNFFEVRLDEELEVVRNGIRWSVNPADYEHSDVFWRGSKDAWELFHLRRLLAPNCVMLDIGANIGYYSLTLAKAFEGQCQIHAFEPHPKTRSRLVRHIEWNNLSSTITAHPDAVTDAPGAARMVERPDNSGATRIDDGKQGFEVTTTTLDEFVDSIELPRIDCLKIDVEGVEARVLRGGRRAIAQFRPLILIEFWNHGLANAGSSSREVADLLADYNYVLYSPHSRHPRPIASLPRGDDPENVLCVPREKTPLRL